MTFKELLASEHLRLPIIQKDGSFLNNLETVLINFNECIEQLVEEDLNIENAQYPQQQPWAIKGFINLFIEGLLKSVRYYYDGKPTEAYNTFSKTMDNWDSINLKINELKNGENFYRIRVHNSNYLLPTSEMFHIPFEKRGLIRTQRYSIPGFPSLYLGRTIYGCWEEMRRPNIQDFQAIRLTNVSPIKCLDLVPPIYNGTISEENYMYVMTWPLIASCSVMVKHPEHDFKPEYIIPQLLLQWVRQEPSIDGIRYNSTHAQIIHQNTPGDFSNIVLPVKEVCEIGHCKHLKSMFNTTDSISWQLQQFAIGGGSYLYSGGGELDDKIPQLKIIDGRSYPYSMSTLGDIERFLLGMPTKPMQ